MASTSASPQPITRGGDRVIVGVASGIAERVSVAPWWIRGVFIALTVVGGIGIPAYVVLALLMPEPDSDRLRSSSSLFAPSSLQRVFAIGLILVGSLLLLRNTGWGWNDAVVWPVTLGGVGVAVLWARTDEDDRARFTQAANRLPGRPLEALTGGRQALLRLSVGSVLLVAGIGVFLATNDAFAATRQVLLAVGVTAAGLALMLGPWIRRLIAELGAERQQRIRSEERAEMAAHLHDSVLQTLALIQRNADRPRELVALARRQERELRSWLYETGAPGTTGSLAVAVRTMAEEVEALHGVTVEVVVVGDCEVNGHVEALVHAAREAAVNAAKHSGADEVSVYVEAEADKVSAFVRDRGQGFDVGSVPSDRQGIARSITERMVRHGGLAVVTSTPGDGTEVALEMPL